MRNAEFSHATLILAGHGSTTNPDSERPVFQHAAELRRRGVFGSVREAFWKQQPLVTTVMSEASSPLVIIVPLFISEGYFTEEVIPEALGFRRRGQEVFSRTLRRGTQTLFYGRPVGTHESMAKVILARAVGVLDQFPFPRKAFASETTLFIAGHGTDRNANSRRAIERQSDLIRARNLFAAVWAVFMEEAPRIEECPLLARTENIVLVPFFISDGLHASEDIPVLLGEPRPEVEERLRLGQPAWRNPTKRNGKLIWYASSVGSEPSMADVVLERAVETFHADAGEYPVLGRE